MEAVWGDDDTNKIRYNNSVKLSGPLMIQTYRENTEYNVNSSLRIFPYYTEIRFQTKGDGMHLRLGPKQGYTNDYGTYMNSEWSNHMSKQ